ncbi:Vacuolar protein sorting-associated protein 53 [Malassezia pachydermatis]
MQAPDEEEMAAVCREVDALLQHDGTSLGMHHVEQAQAHIYTRLTQHRQDTQALAAQAAQHKPDLHAHEAKALLSSLSELEEHAARAEHSVGEITAEIRWLDMAKRNVSQSIVTLRRLQMLVSSTFQLEQVCEDQQYREAASTLQALQALLAYFEPFGHVPAMAQQRTQIEALRAKLQRMAMEEYEKAFQQQARVRIDANESSLPDVALVVDALGGDVTHALLDWYCTRQLREYRRVFRAADEAGQLDNVARRYAWVRRLLRTYTSEHAPAFLPQWHVEHRLLALFADITFDDLKSVLVREQPRLDVDTLLQALHVTNEFEAYVEKQYHTSLAALCHGRALSSAFTPYLGVFVDAQDKVLAEKMSQWAASATQAQTADTSRSAQAEQEEPMHVLLSSTDLIAYYRQTLERCAQLGPQAPLTALAHVYAKWLRRYASDVLMPALQSRDALYLCTVLNTADYCATTCTQLAERVTEKIRAADAQAAPFLLDTERDAFLGALATALQSLVRALHLALDPAFLALAKPDTPWTQRDHVDEKSPWIDLLASGLERIGVLVRHHVENKRYVRSWCDKAVVLVTTRLAQTLVRLRPIRRIVAQQLQADVQHVRDLLLDLPHFDAPSVTGTWGSGSGAAAPTPTSTASSAQSAYRRHVDKALTRIAPWLPVLATPPEPRAWVDAYRQHVGDQSLTNFQKLLDLHGMRRVDQNPMVEEFLAAIDRAPDALPTSSPLSSLQLDPNAEVYAMPEWGSERKDDTPESSATPSRPGTPSSAVTGAMASAASLSLPDWKRFGSMFGVALGQRRP